VGQQLNDEMQVPLVSRSDPWRIVKKRVVIKDACTSAVNTSMVVQSTADMLEELTRSFEEGNLASSISKEYADLLCDSGYFGLSWFGYFGFPYENEDTLVYPGFGILWFITYDTLGYQFVTFCFEDQSSLVVGLSSSNN
nr:hypothetical protein [Tanacetum cinerariifolium]